ncbi:MAG: GAF domain-containing protein [Burkholderiales bacterium]|nr:GAF domain-containing protein [Burkholderiales bacterium]
MTDYSDVQTLCGQFDRKELGASSFLEKCTRLIAAIIGCDRVGVWLFEEAADGRVLRCLSLYDGIKDRTTLVPDETSVQVGAYFEALERVGHVVANDARTHPATAGFFSERVSGNGVRSLMAASFSVNGCLFGAFTCTHVGIAEWSPVQLATLKRTGARVSLALANASRTNQPTLPMPL